MSSDLSRLRAQIDRIDDELIRLLAQRARLTAAVGEHKSVHGLPLYVPEREAELLAARRQAAAAAQVNPDLVEDVLRRVMRESYATQDARFPATGDLSRPVVIVGGAGALGRCLGTFFARSGYPLRMLEKDDWPRAREVLADAALVLVAVPIDRTCAVIRALPDLPADCVLADVTSIKSAPLEAMLDRHAGPVVGLHPMFGPDVSSLAKQVIVVCHGRGQAHYRWLLEQMGLWGAVLREESPAQHDRAMVLIQAMRHFTSMAYGVFLQRQDADLQELMRLSSPIYRLELAMVGRLFAQSPALYADIIMAAARLPELLGDYRQALDELLQLVRDGRRDALIERFHHTQGYFGELAPALLRESSELLRKAHDSRDPARG